MILQISDKRLNVLHDLLMGFSNMKKEELWNRIFMHVTAIFPEMLQGSSVNAFNERHVKKVLECVF